MFANAHPPLSQWHPADYSLGSFVSSLGEIYRSLIHHGLPKVIRKTYVSAFVFNGWIFLNILYSLGIQTSHCKASLTVKRCCHCLWAGCSLFVITHLNVDMCSRSRLTVRRRVHAQKHGGFTCVNPYLKTKQKQKHKDSTYPVIFPKCVSWQRQQTQVVLCHS